MSHLQQQFKMWYDKIQSRQISYDKIGIRPTREWRMILITIFILLCFSAVATFYFYREVNQGKLFVVVNNDTETQVKINKTLLKKTVDEINAREASMNQINAGKVSLPDPWL